MIWICYQLSWLMIIPWAIFAMWSTLWPSTEQNNYKLLDWSRWVITVWLVVPMMWKVHHCIIDGLCCNLSKSSDPKKTQKCRDYVYLPFWVMDIGFGAFECFLAILGTLYLCNMEKGASTWFYASMIMMDIFCWLHFLAYTGVFCMVVSVTCCFKDKSKSANKDMITRLVANDRHHKMISMFHPAENKKAVYEQSISGYHDDMY